MIEVNEFELFRRIGQNLKEARERAGYTQDDVAFTLGLIRTSVTNIESGKQRIQLVAIYKMCRLLQIELSDVLPPLDEIATGETLSPHVKERIEELETQLAFLRSLAGKNGGKP